MIGTRAAPGWIAIATLTALMVGCLASDQQLSERVPERTPAGLPYRLTLPARWQTRPPHVSVGPAVTGISLAGASCVPAEIFAEEREQYCVGPVDGGSGNYILVSTWPVPPGVDQLSDADLLTRFTDEYEETTASAVVDPRTVRVAGRPAVLFTSEGATAEAPWARFYLVIGSPLVVQIYCEYGGLPDQKQAILNGCEQIARTLEIKPG